MKAIVGGLVLVLTSSLSGARDEPNPILGDFTGDGQLTLVDLDVLSHAVARGEAFFDLNGDRLVDSRDRQTWLHDLKGTCLGDTNLDGRFAPDDLVRALQSGEYDDGLPSNSTWAQGDWDGDLEFDSQDLISAFKDDCFERPARGAMVPAAGDWTFDGQLESDDLDLLTQVAVRGIGYFDLNRDGLLSVADVNVWVMDLRYTWIGDANLDGAANSTDLILVFQGGKYEQDIDARWMEGDWNADLRANSSDLVAAIGSFGCGGWGGYECGPRAALTAPEPETPVFVLLWAVVLIVCHRRSARGRTRWVLD